jgi:hypothetical protein
MNASAAAGRAAAQPKLRAAPACELAERSRLRRNDRPSRVPQRRWPSRPTCLPDWLPAPAAGSLEQRSCWRGDSSPIEDDVSMKSHRSVAAVRPERVLDVRCGWRAAWPEQRPGSSRRTASAARSPSGRATRRRRTAVNGRRLDVSGHPRADRRAERISVP